MRTFVREKKIYCGGHYREVDIFTYTDGQKIAASRGNRSKKVKESPPKQKNLNDVKRVRVRSEIQVSKLDQIAQRIFLQRSRTRKRKQQTSSAGSSTQGRKRACRR